MLSLCDESDVEEADIKFMECCVMWLQTMKMLLVLSHPRINV